MRKITRKRKDGKQKKMKEKAKEKEAEKEKDKQKENTKENAKGKGKIEKMFMVCPWSVPGLLLDP